MSDRIALDALEAIKKRLRLLVRWHRPHPRLVPLSDTPHEERRSAMNDDPECRHGESLSGPPCADCLTGGPFISRTRPLMGPPKTEDPDA